MKKNKVDIKSNEDNLNFDVPKEEILIKTEDNNKKSKKRILLWILILFLFLLLNSLFFVMDEVSFYVNVKRTKIQQVPIETIKEVKEQLPIQSQVCQNQTFRFDVIQGNLGDNGYYLQPNVRLINLEEQWGFYQINFSYFDDAKYPFDEYGKDKIFESITSGKLDFSNAEFFSQNFYYYLGPGESKLIENNTVKPIPTMTYWLVYYVKAPTYEYCTLETIYKETIVNKTFTEYKGVSVTNYVKEYVTLKQALKIDSFGQWFILVLMFILILILLMKIYKRRKEWKFYRIISEKYHSRFKKEN